MLLTHELDHIAQAVADGDKLTPMRWIAKYGSLTSLFNKTIIEAEYKTLYEDLTEITAEKRTKTNKLVSRLTIGVRK